MLLAPFVPLKRRTPIIFGDGSHILRAALGLSLAVLFLLAPFAFPTSAQSVSSPKETGFDYFVIYQNTAGDLVCRGATPAERRDFDRIDPSTQNLRPINHLQADRYAHRRIR